MGPAGGWRDRFDQSRLAAEREHIIGAGPRPGSRTRRRRMRVYAGMDPRLALRGRRRHAQTGRGGWATTGCTSPRRSTIHGGRPVGRRAHRRIIVRTSVTLAFPRSPTLLAYAAWDLANSAAGASSSGWARRSARTSRTATPCRSGRTRSPASATTSGPSARPSPRSPPARFHLRERALPDDPPAALFNPGPDADTWHRRSTSEGCNARPAPWPARSPTASSATRRTRTPATWREVPARPGRGGQERGPRPRRDGFEAVIGTSVVTGRTPGAVLAERERQRRLLAFLYSTPAYAPTLALRMGRPRPEAPRPDPPRPLGRPGHVLSDEMLDALVPCGTFDELPDLVLGRFAGLGQGIVVSPPPEVSKDEAFRAVVAALQAA